MLLESLISRRFPSIAKALEAVEASTEALMTIDKPLATLWAQTQLKGTPTRDMLFLVAGLGEHVSALLPRLDPSSILVIYEASLPRLKTILKNKDYEGILGDPRVHLFAGRVGAQEFERLHDIPAARISDVASLKFNPAWALDSKTYELFFAEFARQLEVVRRLHLTNFHDSIFWQASTLANIPYHHQSPDIAVLKDKFPGVPVVLVGAGPSLEEAGDFLRVAQQRALIIASNSSYKQLVALGLRPHLLLAADPRRYTFQGIEGEPLDNVTLVAPFIVHPEVTQAFQGRAFSWSGDNNFVVSLLRRKLGLGEGTCLLEKGTISLSIADFAVLLGSRELYLVGQDMATSQTGQSHASCSIYTDLKANKVTLKFREDSSTGSGNARRVPGNTQPWVPTLDNLYTYLKLFEQWVELNPAVKVHNTARNGAKIKGAEYIDYAAASALLQKTAPQRDFSPELNAFLQNAPEKAYTLNDWIEAAKPTLDYLEKLFAKATLGAVSLEMLPDKFQQPSYQNHREIREIFDLTLEINRLIESQPDNYRVALEGFLKKRLLDFQRLLSTLEAPNPHAQLLLKNKEFLWALSEGIEPTLGHLKKLLSLYKTSA